MKKLNEIFAYETGNLPALEHTENGSVPLIYGTTKNNGVIKLVSVYEDTKVYNPPLITVSYLGTAFVQTTKFTTSVVDKSNITILLPREKISIEELYFYCFQINKIANFGFNYGRRMNQKQLNKIKLIEFDPSIHKFLNLNLKSRLPSKQIVAELPSSLNIKEYPLTKFFKIVKGKGLYKYQYEPGSTPLVSATSFNNGILENVDTEPTFTSYSITVERIKGNAFVQLKPYATIPDDISVLIPIRDLRVSTLFYFAYLIRNESWRYSYGRKFSPTRLKNLVTKIPVLDNNELDEDSIEQFCKNSYGWKEIIASS